jgi:HK97 family phage major capsid protein
MNIAARIAEKKAKLVAIKDGMVLLNKKLEADSAYELTDEESATVELLSAEAVTISKAIENLTEVEKSIALNAQPVNLPAGINVNRGIANGPHAKKEPVASMLIKGATVQLIAHLEKKHPEQVIAERYSDDDRVLPVHKHLTKSATGNASTTQVGWANELIRDEIGAFLETLVPVSAYAALRAAGTPLDFGGAQSITIPRRGGNPTDMAGAFVGENGAIPVGRTTLGSTKLNRYKMAVISTFTNELLERSTPSIEALVRQAIVEDTGISLDNALLDASAAVVGVRPASILNGVAGQASAGNTAADVITDLKFLMSYLATANIGAAPYLLINPVRLISLSTLTNATGTFIFRDEIAGGRLMGMQFISSTNVPSTQVIIIDASSFSGANDAPDFTVSDQATLVMANADGTAPTQAGDATDGTGGDLGTAGQVPAGGGIAVTGNGTGAPAGTSVTNYQAMSMFQTYSTAVRMILPTSWGMSRPNVINRITGVGW